MIRQTPPEENDEGIFGTVGQPWRNGGWRSYLRSLLPAIKPASRRLGDLEICLEAQRVTMRGQELALTLTEFHLLAWLASNPDRLFTYRGLVRLVQGYDCRPEEARKIIKVHMMNLRRKLNDDVAAPRYIFCVRGVGYRFAKEVETDTAGTEAKT